MTKEQFLGTWRLISWEIRDSDGNVSYPYGQDAAGLLIYAPDGYMSGTLTKPNRPHFAGGDIFGGTLEEQALATQTYLAYCSRYEIKEKSVLHYVEFSLFPNWVGMVQERFFEFKDGQLSLSTPPMVGQGKQQIAYLIWKRV
ncbi:MAG: lipocalin-like domain-containing protein [Nostoc sp. CreGUA01]|nr:lipocalin-like domain-containing protein [Nostoc sp. CreGUA01]